MFALLERRRLPRSGMTSHDPLFRVLLAVPTAAACPGSGRLIRLARLYGHHSPIRRGKMRLAAIALKLDVPLPPPAILTTADGSRFHIDLSDTTYRELYFVGDYEPAITDAVRRLLRPGDHVTDVGANFGWFTMLFARLVGPSGSVHSFEPVPTIYSKLRKNVQLNKISCPIHSHRVALGDSTGTVRMHTFLGLPDGHSSISSLGRTDYEECEADVLTLDRYWSEVGCPDMSLIKCDAEGSEMAIVRGADALLNSRRPPIWLLEANSETSAAMGYRPTDLIHLLNSYGYVHALIRPGRRRLLWGVPPQHGDTILAYRPDLHGSRVELLR